MNLIIFNIKRYKFLLELFESMTIKKIILKILNIVTLLKNNNLFIMFYIYKKKVYAHKVIPTSYYINFTCKEYKKLINYFSENNNN